MKQAKTQLSQLIAAAEKGEGVVIDRGGEPVAQLLSMEERKPVTRVFGALPKKELAAWEDAYSGDADKRGGRSIRLPWSAPIVNFQR